MENYAVFLRGINVGGNKKIPMADLKGMLSEMGFTNVRTVLNSGNVFVTGQGEELSKLELRIERQIADTFGFPVPVIVRPAERLIKLLAEAPFGNATPDKKIKWLVTLRKDPGEKLGLTADIEGLELVYEAEDLICSRIDLSRAGTLDAMKLLETRYGKEITTRTWQTLEKLLQP